MSSQQSRSYDVGEAHPDRRRKGKHFLEDLRHHFMNTTLFYQMNIIYSFKETPLHHFLTLLLWQPYFFPDSWIISFQINSNIWTTYSFRLSLLTQFKLVSSDFQMPCCEYQLRIGMWGRGEQTLFLWHLFCSFLWHGLNLELPYCAVSWFLISQRQVLSFLLIFFFLRIKELFQSPVPIILETELNIIVFSVISPTLPF